MFCGKGGLMERIKYIEACNMAERALLGSILLNPELKRKVIGTIRAGDFYGGKKSLHGKIYTAMITVEHPDQISVARQMYEQWLCDGKELAELSYLVADCITDIDWEYYMNAVLKFSVDRATVYYTSTNELDKVRSATARLNPEIPGGIRL